MNYLKYIIVIILCLFFISCSESTYYKDGVIIDKSYKSGSDSFGAAYLQGQKGGLTPIVKHEPEKFMFLIQFDDGTADSYSNKNIYGLYEIGDSVKVQYTKSYIFESITEIKINKKMIYNDMVVEESSLSRSIWDAEYVGAKPTYHTLN